MWFNGKRKEVYHDIIECLVGALEAKDYYTSGHSERVGNMAYDLAFIVGIKGKQLEEIHIAAHLHDIGKIGVSDKILNKEGKLLPHEWEAIKRHPDIGYKILNKSKKLRNISKIVLHHHERWDGKGYPEGLDGQNIPIGSRIISICDSIDAMMSQRPYRKPLLWNECQNEIMINKAIQFDAVLVDAAQKIWDDWAKTY